MYQRLVRVGGIADYGKVQTERRTANPRRELPLLTDHFVQYQIDSIAELGSKSSNSDVPVVAEKWPNGSGDRFAGERKIDQDLDALAVVTIPRTRTRAMEFRDQPNDVKPKAEVRFGLSGFIPH